MILDGADSRVIIGLSQISDSHPAKCLVACAAKEMDRITDDATKNPIIGCRDAREDIRYKLGMAAALKWVLSLEDIAKTIIKRTEE